MRHSATTGPIAWSIHGAFRQRVVSQSVHKRRLNYHAVDRYYLSSAPFTARCIPYNSVACWVLTARAQPFKLQKHNRNNRKLSTDRLPYIRVFMKIFCTALILSIITFVHKTTTYIVSIRARWACKDQRALTAAVKISAMLLHALWHCGNFRTDFKCCVIYLGLNLCLYIL